jgi:hypothetical protein
MVGKCVKTNFEIISNNKVNVELLLLLTKIRSVIYAKDKATLTVNVDNTDDSLSFNFSVNNNEVEPIKLNNEFNII